MFSTKIRFLASGFLFTCGISSSIFSFFKVFNLIFFSKWFLPIHSVIFSCSFLFSQRKFFELCARTCPAMFFVSSSDAFFIFVHTAKLNQSKFLNEFLPSLTAFTHVTSFRILSLAKVLSSFA